MDGQIPMKIKRVPDLSPSQERRRFGRIQVSEPRICHIHLPQSQELWANQGILMNISLGGIYFVSDTPPPLEKDDISYLTFETVCADQITYRLGMHVAVVRTERKPLDAPRFAVAFRLLSEPIYYSPEETEGGESLLLDKSRIMYQYYHLNRKAYEIIKEIPEVRTDKINHIKEYLDKGSYEVQSEKVTQRFIKAHLLENALIIKR